MSLLRFGALLLLLSAGNTTAEETWWFDVEVILFDRNQALTELEEQFDYADNMAPYQADLDLISETLAPNIRRISQSLPRCDAPPTPLWQPEPDLETLLDDYRQWQATQAVSSTQQSDAVRDDPDNSRDADAQPDTIAGQQRVSAAVDVPPEVDGPPEDTENLVSDQDIVGYWLSFHGVDNVPVITVPGVSYCQPEPVWFSYENGRWTRPANQYAVPMPDEVPILPDGVLWPDASVAHLLPADTRELKDLSQQIRRTRGLTRLLHANWRQEVVFGRDEAPTIRLIAGKNYTNDFTANGNQRSDAAQISENAAPLMDTQDSLFERLDARLTEPEAIDFNVMMAAYPEQPQSNTVVRDSGVHAPIWQIDGGIKVFLRYINRVPYLHIDSELFYRQPVPLENDGNASPDSTSTLPEYQLVSVPFSQLRRVISTQVHYFDHPLFGMVVQIRRYRQPDADDEESQ